MAYTILASRCTGCSGCQSQCPQDAIREEDGVFAIDSGSCTECEGFFEVALCAAVCPYEDVIVPASLVLFLQTSEGRATWGGSTPARIAA